MNGSPLEQLAGGLVVSCQAPPGSPLRRPDVMAAMAQAAEQAGAVAIRAEGAADITAIRTACSLPIIGIRKQFGGTSDVFITATMSDVTEVVDAGADIVAVDGTLRPRPDGGSTAEFLDRVLAIGVPVMADVDSAAAASAAADRGVHLIATTLAGYTAGGAPAPTTPDIELITRIRGAVPDVRVVAEGRYATPDDLAEAFAAGAYAVVVGTAITDTLDLARRFAHRTPLLQAAGERSR